MPVMTLQQAFEAYKTARAEEAVAAAVRKDAEERAAEAKKDHQAKATAMDNAKTTLDNHIRLLSEPTK